MIVYYTHSQKTKIAAEALGKVLRLPLWELKSPLDNKPAFIYMLRALLMPGSDNAWAVSNMPGKIENGGIYVCSPIWAGNLAGPVRYFLRHAPLKNNKVNLLLTCGSATGVDTYKKKALETLRSIDCTAGDVYAFGLGGVRPEPAVMEAQLREMLPGAE